jgi:hypothetical protein
MFNKHIPAAVPKNKQSNGAKMILPMTDNSETGSPQQTKIGKEAISKNNCNSTVFNNHRVVVCVKRENIYKMVEKADLWPNYC